MNVEKLVLLVQERRYLWDQRESNYHMRNVQHMLWSEVSAEMNEPGKYLTSIQFILFFSERIVYKISFESVSYTISSSSTPVFTSGCKSIYNSAS
jgi:hypothetical protein